MFFILKKIEKILFFHRKFFLVINKRWKDILRFIKRKFFFRLLKIGKKR